MRNLFAYTEPGKFYPPYISVNEEDGVVEITVRSVAKVDGACGETASIKLSAKQFDDFVVSIQK